jgi:hypothetical protein
MACMVCKKQFSFADRKKVGKAKAEKKAEKKQQK